ncbi:hypothetical protein JQ596_04290 [Bradyrhizobium manausense]|uniref:hypothetical protein n=1 Tax=Bradyrhizobium TaxID=374 RepID=UPI001BA5E613|nr:MULTISPECIES: hypothetical protein [Bradyrhizobium]MBR0824747.1 hypothetical protein [Bradyrhizobium manausense]UVO29474.1 hypothetical protein KUF59_01485 [Bradyrhizobium arachidis]
MPPQNSRQRPGLCLLPDMLQPFLLRYRQEDLHIMAFFAGHPDYEAVEAMIKFGADGKPGIRAILTRHDQTQIDHVNDDRLFAEAWGVERQTCWCDIDLTTTHVPGRRHARLAFVSHAGEQVVFDITTVGEPDSTRGGLSNPGTHSPRSSLPLMLRHASTLAGPQTMVVVDGRRYDVPVKIRSGPFVAQEGYYTERHVFGAVRAGTSTSHIKARPERFVAGASWVLERDGRTTTYRIDKCDPDGTLRILEADTADEMVVATVADDALWVTEISKIGDSVGKSGLALAFGPNEQFEIAMDGKVLVTGAYEASQRNEANRVVLTPTQPDWATSRPISLACMRQGDTLIATTTIGRD